MAPKVTITILDGSLVGTDSGKHEFTESCQCSIGRSANCKILFPGDKSDGYTGVSGEHCLLEIDPPNVKIKSLSDKKASLNGRAIEEKFQVITFSGSNGEIIKLGKDDVRIRINLTGNSPLDKVFKNSKKLSPFIKPILNFVLDFMDMGEQPSQPHVQTQPQPINNDSSPGEKKNIPLEIRQYQIYGSLGKSGLGEVYLATTPKGKNVVIKTMLSDTSSNLKDVARFEREIDNIKYLDHPNIIKSIDRGIQCNKLYYVMEYCEAGSLERTIEQMGGKLPLDLAKSIILQVLDGLEYIHNIKFQTNTEEDGYKNVCGMVHRNIEPKNILLTINRLNLVAKIGNFGLSKSFENAGNSGITSIEDRVSKAHPFLSRQQFKDSLNSKPEVDVWAAAACLYYMLSGEYPRDFSDDIDPDQTVLEQPVIPIKTRNPDIPDLLAEVIDLALCEDKELHYKSATDFKQALLSALE
jgi:eukaryotic-like serine/threonine-protein kinase